MEMLTHTKSCRTNYFQLKKLKKVNNRLIIRRLHVCYAIFFIVTDRFCTPSVSRTKSLQEIL